MPAPNSKQAAELARRVVAWADGANPDILINPTPGPRQGLSTASRHTMTGFGSRANISGIPQTPMPITPIAQAASPMDESAMIPRDESDPEPESESDPTPPPVDESQLFPMDERDRDQPLPPADESSLFPMDDSGMLRMDESAMVPLDKPAPVPPPLPKRPPRPGSSAVI